MKTTSIFRKNLASELILLHILSEINRNKNSIIFFYNSIKLKNYITIAKYHETGFILNLRVIDECCASYDLIYAFLREVGGGLHEAEELHIVESLLMSGVKSQKELPHELDASCREKIVSLVEV